MSGENPQAERSPDYAGIASTLTDILACVQFHGQGSRSSSRKKEIPGPNDTSYSVTHTRFERNFNWLNSYTIAVTGPAPEQVVRFHYSADTRQLHINGTLSDGPEAWQDFGDTLERVALAKSLSESDET